MTQTTDRMLPLYESKMLHQYDHRWATYTSDGSTRHVTPQEKDEPNFAVMPRYWVDSAEVDKLLDPDELLVSGWRKICRATDERTLISFGFPRAGLGDSANVASTSHSDSWLLTAAFGSFVLDYVARQKIGGTNFNFFQMAQLPILPAEGAVTLWTQDSAWLVSRFLELTYTSHAMADVALSAGDALGPFRWDPERRTLLRAELDAAFFHLYGVARDDVDYIMESFPIVKKKDLEAHGEFRTKRLILEIFDAIQAAIDTGSEYQTILDPPPGEGPRHPAELHTNA